MLESRKGGFVPNTPSAKGESGRERIYPLDRQVEMPRVWRDENGTWIDGEFVSDQELALNKVTTVETTEIGGKGQIWELISTSPIYPNPFYDMFIFSGRKQGKTAALRSTLQCGKNPLYEAWMERKSYPNKHEENAMRNLGCRGKMGYKESFYDRWPTKKSKVGSMFFFLGFLIKDLIHVYRRACASSDNSNYFAR